MPERPRRVTTEAIVLRRAELGEADRLLTLYTRDLGKVKALAKGVRKPTSRKAGHLDQLTHTRVLLAQGRTFAIVAQAEAVHTYPRLREDLERFALASYCAELIDRFIYEGESQPGVFHLLRTTLSRLDEHPRPWLAVRYFEVRLLDHLGFRPQLFRCVACGQTIRPEPQFFSATQGGILCPRCGSGVRDARPVSVEALKYLRHFQRSDFANAEKARPRANIQQEIEALMQTYLTHLLERPVNAARFLRRLPGLKRQSE